MSTLKIMENKILHKYHQEDKVGEPIKSNKSISCYDSFYTKGIPVGQWINPIVREQLI